MGNVRRLDEQFTAELESILGWAEQSGISRATRFHIYRDNLKLLRANDKEEDRARLYEELALQGRLTEILSTMAETIELVETIPVLRNTGVEIPRELLKRVFSGPLDAFQEDHTSNQARNGMFELSVGAMAARRGLNPRLSAGNPDVTFSFENRSVKVECKRVLSEGKIQHRLQEGINQLNKSTNVTNSDIGLVAISLSKILNPGDKFLVSDNPHEALSAYIGDVLKRDEQRLGLMRRPSAAGLIFFLSSVSYVPGKGYSPVNAGTVFALDLKQQLFLRRLAANLSV